MKKLLPFFLMLFFLASHSFAQQAGEINTEDLETIHTNEDSLSFLSYSVINDSLAENRFAACRELIKKLVQTLKTENSFNYPFDRLKAVSIQYPKDSTFRIFTWQLYVDQENYRYYGAIQMNTPELNLFPLIDRSFQIEDADQQILQADNWYGALYYNIIDTEGPNGKYYLLFGFDGNSFFNKRKLLDVLIFREGKPLFGAPVFGYKDEVAGTFDFPFNRMIMEYSAEASVKLNFDDIRSMVLFDHLVLMGGNYGQGPVNVPDGSYEAFELNNGLWMHVDKVFHEVSDEAPRPSPILNENKKDLFGKEKNR